MPELRQAFVGAGANLGNRCATLRLALQQLRDTPGIAALASSPVYESDPVGPPDQPRFLNLVAGVETSLEPEALLAELLRIEQHFGRVRTIRWGPRTLDLDLLVFEGESRNTPSLELPHPRMLERPFVTTPLRDLIVQPRFRRPGWNSLRRDLARLAPATSGLHPFPGCHVP
jgi:2-amino-4-hydroxy-6-hydroxymethyldihydropteridine diphosphokinase